MAPMAPLGKAGALAQLRKGASAIAFGSPHPHTMIVEQDGRWRIRALVVDPAEADADAAEARRQGRNWMPEHYYGLGKPVGAIHVDAASRDELIAAIEKMTWPPDW